MLKKYATIFNMNWQAGFAYPLSLFLWRFRQFLTTVMSLTIWTVIFSQSNSVFGYSQNQMTTYIFIISLLQGAILATNLHQLAGQIYSGEVSHLLIKPVNIFNYFAAIEVADKAKNVLCIIIESLLLFWIFKPEIFLPTLSIWLIFGSWIIFGIIIHFFIEILFGTLGFWSPQTWGPKFVFFMLVDAVAGKLFPLDILPTVIKQLLFLTPLPYLSYIQTQLFLGRLQTQEILPHTLGLITWSILLGIITVLVWKKGIKSYAAAGS